MGRLIVIEGLDGAGKRTLSDALTVALDKQGASVALGAFPRYGKDVHADLVREGLHGELGGLGESVYGMAALYALDRHGAREQLLAELSSHDVLLLDRYVSSNAAYAAARLHQDAHGEVVDWVRALEIDRLGLPLPHTQLLLRVPAQVAAARSAHRENTGDRGRDVWESDDDLQARCAAVYDGLAARSWLSPWRVLDGATGVDAEALAEALIS